MPTFPNQVHWTFIIKRVKRDNTANINKTLAFSTVGLNYWPTIGLIFYDLLHAVCEDYNAAFPVALHHIRDQCGREEQPLKLASTSSRHVGTLQARPSLVVACMT